MISKRVVFAWLFSGVALLSGARTLYAAGAPVSNSGGTDMFLLEQESKFETEKTRYLQENVLDKS